MSKQERKGKKVLVIAGPTASGKSALALKAALRFAGYIVNADAMQIYKDLPILSAQPSQEALAASPHRLYGLLPLNEPCSAVHWAKRARAVIRDESGLPIIVGGTGLYLRSLLEGLSPIPDIPTAIQEEGKGWLAREGAAGLHQRLHILDPLMAERLHPHDSHRILRAWCVMRATGLSLAEWQKFPPSPSGLDPLYLVMMPKKASLYDLCGKRFLRMMEEGALEEVRGALSLYGDQDLSLPGFKTLGFRELAAYLKGEARLENAVAAAQQHTRNYAKRQVTWFSHQLPKSNKIIELNEYEELLERIEIEVFPKIKEFLFDQSA